MQILRLVALALLLDGVSVAMEQETSQNLDAASLKLVDAARENLAAKLSAAPEHIALIVFEKRVWPDAGMGCPQPGMVYAQVQRDGYRLQLEVRGQRYWYHGGAGRKPFYCANPTQQPNPPVPPPDQRV